MKARFYEDIEEFYHLAFPFLMKREVENNLLLAILKSLKKKIQAYGSEKPLLFALSEHNEIKLIVLRTPPHDLLISYPSDLDTIDILVEELINRKEELPGVLSFKDAAEKFAYLWCEKNSLTLQILRKERIYQLEDVSKETIGDNQFSVASKSFQPIVLKWAKEMMKEALLEISKDEIEQNITHFKAEFEDDNSSFYLLYDDNEPVSMARKAGKTPNGNFVNFVYTPPSLRRRGYATECVAKLSKQLLEEGNTYCFLFTDLSNPISNSIYQKVGYRPVIDELHFKFLK